MTTPASPRKAANPQPPIGSPRLHRNSLAPPGPCPSNGGVRLSAIGRMALRDRTSSQQHSAALYGGGGSRLWPGRFADPGCVDRPPLVRKADSDSRPQSARGAPQANSRSSSAPRYPSAQRGSSVPRAAGGSQGGYAPPQRAASSLDCHSATEARAAGGSYPPPIPQGGQRRHSTYNADSGSTAQHRQSAVSADSHVRGTTAMQEDLGVRSKVPSEKSLAQTVETLLQGKLNSPSTPGRQASPRASPGVHARTALSKSSPAASPASRNMSAPTIMDELVLYTEPQADADAKPGLGSLQPRGRAQVMHQWLRPDAVPQQASDGYHRASNPLTARPLLKSSAQQAAAAAPDGACAMELEWSSLSDSAKQAMKLWVSGQLGGRHCMLVLEQGGGISDAVLLPSSTAEPTMSDLRRGAALNVLSGLFAEVGLLSSQGSGSWLFETVFSKQPQQVLEEALQSAVVEIGDPRLEKVTDLSLEQANLALRRMAMKVQFKGCTAKAPEDERKIPGEPRSGDDFTKIQVWMELVRLHSDGWPRPGTLEGTSSQPGHKDRTVSGRAPAERGGFGDGGVLSQLNKQEFELETESQQMSLEALRAQNRLIEEYVMRLVRQRDELKLVTKLAEERDCYFILGLGGPDSTDEEVKKAYRNLARKEHPDKAGTGNKKRFQAIQQAYNSIMKQRNGDGSATVNAEGDDLDAKDTPDEACNPVLAESSRYALQACNSADLVAGCAHRALRSWEEGAEGQSGAKRRALRSLRDLTRQSASELKGAAQQLRTLGHAITALVKCSEAFLTENSEMANNSSTGMGLRDRCAIVEDSGRSCTSSAELLERISEATEATLKKVEKASPDVPPGEGGVPPRASSRNDEAANLLRLGVRLLTESLARTAAVGRRSADEAINGASKALELHRGLLMLDAEVTKERRAKNAKKSTFDEDDGPVAAGDVDRSESRQGDSKKDSKKEGGPQRTPRSRPETPLPSQSPRDQLKSAAKRVKDRHVNLRVKNLRFMASLNEEALRVQARLWSLLERSEGTLLPEVSIGQKGVIFDLVAQLMEFGLHETGRLAGNLSAAPVKVLERSLSFALALEHGKEIAMPVDSRTQALKLASLIDQDLLCQVVGGPFRRRLVAIGAKKRGPESLSSGGGYVQAGYTRARGTTSLGVGSAAAVKAWEEAANAYCERISKSIRQAVVRSSTTEDDGGGS
eukprot:CAMPEP_0197624612 /NCGR_PEP_ID=MMETSP1338-20131121/4182_1 /TAXON_ID=43686 ORGANISM="Pelagodinium beii, Strain RCC1491" /NCGR_SAMPLE_ID=MMETSP1338 /ASSEMBLY_ACC=CAM_ASM_000754 /LENGTH=1196 /DNA_ID=CAMNT_0043194775 /DNA_START=133 /DNA_END=3723 /DNA_ORIENTATION=+